MINKHRYKNYTPIVRSFIYQIQRQGWWVQQVNTGGGAIQLQKESGPVDNRKLATEEILSVCDSRITFYKEQMRVTALIILGNGADELVADWSYNTLEADQDFQVGWDKFTNIWTFREVPETNDWEVARGRA